MKSADRQQGKSLRTPLILLVAAAVILVGIIAAILLFHRTPAPGSTAQPTQAAQQPAQQPAQPAAPAEARSITLVINGQEITGNRTTAPDGTEHLEFPGEHGPWSFDGAFDNGVFVRGTVTGYPYALSLADGYSLYTGPFENNLPAGEGTYTVVSGGRTATLTGRYDPESGFSGTASGWSHSVTYNGEAFRGLYSGALSAGKPEGEGSFESAGDRFCNYAGTWRAGNPVGPGRLHTNCALISLGGEAVQAEYDGGIGENGFSGQGTLTARKADGSVYAYSGHFENGVYAGSGTLTVSAEDGSGYTYTGSWADGLYDGEGSLIYTGTEYPKYIGHFEKGEFRPTFVQMIAALSSAGSAEQTATGEALDYLEAHERNFTEHTLEGITVNPAFSYRDYAVQLKHPDETAFRVTLRVAQVRVFPPETFGRPAVAFLGHDESNAVYYGFYAGEAGVLAEGGAVQVTAYPIGYAPVRSESGADVPALRFVAFDLTPAP